jgi:hypothetical protein
MVNVNCIFHADGGGGLGSGVGGGDGGAGAGGRFGFTGVLAGFIDHLIKCWFSIEISILLTVVTYI